MLPEIYESGVWRKYAGSIVEYAGKFGGVPKYAVVRRLRLEKNLKNKPALKEAIRTAGINKVAMVAKIATPETDQIFAEKITNMSKPAIQTLSKEFRHKDPTVESPCKAVPETIKLELDPEMTFLFLKLKKQLKTNSNKETMKKILQQLTEEKNVTGYAFRKKKTTITRPVPSAQKREAGDRCTYPGCNRPADEIHHPTRFSETKNHDDLRPLCSDHHEFAHNNLIPNEHEQKWRINIAGENKKPSYEGYADHFYQRYRKQALL